MSQQLKPLRSRVLHTSSDLKSVPFDHGRLIDFPVTHQELASAVSLTRVSVTRLLQNFEQQGMLERRQRLFVITRAGLQNVH